MIAITDERRARHVYILGKTRSGKTTFIQNFIRQDIERGNGVTFIDPHGDAAEELLDYVPEARIRDTYYFEPVNFPLVLNPLALKGDSEIEGAADDLIYTFRRVLSDNWGPRMDSILRNALYSLLNIPGTTFLDIARILVDTPWRESVLHYIEPDLREFWLVRFPGMPKNATEPLLDRLDKFKLSPTLRRIFSSRDNALNFEQIMDGSKILIVNLGRVKRDTSMLLGSLLVSALQNAVERRVNISAWARVPHYLYVDEFHRFMGGPFDTILSEAAKFGLSLTVAHQYADQLDRSTLKAIMGNVGTTFLLSLGDDDEKYFGVEHLQPFVAAVSHREEPERNYDFEPEGEDADPTWYRGGENPKKMPPRSVFEKQYVEGLITRSRLEQAYWESGYDSSEISAFFPGLEKKREKRRAERDRHNREQDELGPVKKWLKIPLKPLPAPTHNLGDQIKARMQSLAPSLPVKAPLTAVSGEVLLDEEVRPSPPPKRKSNS